MLPSRDCVSPPPRWRELLGSAYHPHEAGRVVARLVSGVGNRLCGGDDALALEPLAGRVADDHGLVRTALGPTEGGGAEDIADALAHAGADISSEALGPEGLETTATAVATTTLEVLGLADVLTEGSDGDDADIGVGARRLVGDGQAGVGEDELSGRALVELPAWNGVHRAAADYDAVQMDGRRSVGMDVAPVHGGDEQDAVVALVADGDLVGGAGHHLHEDLTVTTPTVRRQGPTEHVGDGHVDQVAHGYYSFLKCEDRIRYQSADSASFQSACILLTGELLDIVIPLQKGEPEKI